MIHPSQQAQKSVVPPETAAFLTLVQGAQNGTVSLTDPDGNPTFAAQALQSAQQQAQPQPGMQQAAQNAGIGAQQQAAQQQAAMEQLPQQVQQLAQRQQAMEQGIAGAPGAGTVRMAEGGIVGREERDPMEVIREMLARGEEIPPAMLRAAREQAAMRDRTRLPDPNWGWRPGDDREGGATGSWGDRGSGATGSWGEPEKAPPKMPEVPIPDVNVRGGGGGIGGGAPAFRMPTPPPAPQGPSAAAKMFEEGLGAINKMQAPATPEQELAAFGQQRNVRRTAMQQAGNDPDQALKDIAASEARGAERAAHVAKLEGELAGRSKDAGLIEFLIGARGNKGEGFGRPLATGADAALKGDEGRRKEVRTIAELKFAYQDAAAKEQAALRDAKLKTDMGDFDGAKKSMEEARAFANSKLLAESKLRGDRAGELERTEQVDKQVAQQRYNTDVQALTAKYGDDIRLKVAQIAAAATSDGVDPKEKAAMARLLAAVNSDVPLKTYAKQSELGIDKTAEAKMIARYNELVQQYAPQMANKAPAPAAVAVPAGVTVKKIGP